MFHMNIEAERVRHGLTKEELATVLGVTRKTYQSWITRSTEIPGIKIKIMAELFNVGADYLLAVSDQKSNIGI